MQRGVWIFFDLGIQGDYEGLYSWLDNHNAYACGENLAFIRYEFQDDLFEELKADILGKVKLKHKHTIYIVSKDEAGNVLGKFLHGTHMRPPWTGYGLPEGEEIVHEA